jgi:hypothetical protein
MAAAAKMVWLPTFKSDKHIKTLCRPDAVGLAVAPNGQVSPEMESILKIIARENLVLATGSRASGGDHRGGEEGT